jgi:hypothetical protein
MNATKSRGSGGRFEKVRHAIVIGCDAVLVKNDARIAAMIGTVQAHAQDYLASPRPGLGSVSDDKLTVWSKSLSDKSPA